MFVNTGTGLRRHAYLCFAENLSQAAHGNPGKDFSGYLSRDFMRSVWFATVHLKNIFNGF